MKKDKLNIETIHQCNCCSGNKTLHPLVSVIPLEDVLLTYDTVQLGFYAVLLVEGGYNEPIYGWEYCDYSNASMVFLAPGEFLPTEGCEKQLSKGWLLVFHPDLLCCTSLGEHIKNYTFWGYRLQEALHVSMREKNKVTECLCNIRQELLHAIDRHSKTLICRLIELLLDYCTRFYERQFITRNESNKAILAQTDVLLDGYISSGQLRKQIFPSPAYCAGYLHLSTPYFSDLLKLETGKTLTAYFLQKRLEAARKMLLEFGNTVNETAEKLGFTDMKCFSSLFKQLTGSLPEEYRMQH